MSKSNKYVATNKNAVIANRIDRTGKWRTETSRRDEGSLNAAISTDSNSNTTRLFLDFPDASVSMSGREARTLFRLLSSHYGYTNKSFV